MAWAATSPVLWPTLDTAGTWDEAIYLQSGRLLAEVGEWPPFAYNPAMAVFYGVIYLVVGASPDWYVRAATIGRWLLAAILWSGTVAVAGRLGGSRSQLAAMLGLTVVPVIVGLGSNSSDFLFAGLSAWALAHALAATQGECLSSRRLLAASTVLAGAAFVRNDGLVLFPLFLVLVLAPRWRVLGWRPVAATVLPFLLLVGGYLAVKPDLHLRERSYVAFEQGQGVVYAERYGDRNPHVEGQIEARALYSTPEANAHSIVRAISRNPRAFAERLWTSVRRLPAVWGDAYGPAVGAVLVGLAAIALTGPVPLVVAAWPAHLLIYALTFLRPGYLLLPIGAVLALAAFGMTRLGRRLPAWAFAVPLVVVLIVRMPQGGGAVWSSAEMSPKARAVAFIQQTFPPAAVVASYDPSVPVAAKRRYVGLYLELRHLQSPDELWRWLRAHDVAAIFVDAGLRRDEPHVWSLIVAAAWPTIFSAGDAQILTVPASP